MFIFPFFNCAVERPLIVLCNCQNLVASYYQRCRPVNATAGGIRQDEYLRPRCYDRLSIYAVIFDAFVAADYCPTAPSAVCDPLWVWCIRKEISFMYLDTYARIAEQFCRYLCLVGCVQEQSCARFRLL